MLSNPLLDEIENQPELPGGYGVVTPFSSGDALWNKIASGKPAVSSDPTGAVNYFAHNPGAAALSYALSMNQGVPDAVAVTASNMPWMAHYRDPNNTRQYQPMPEMQHTALGALPQYYKIYNQIGGAGAYGGKAGASSNPVSTPTSMGSADRQSLADEMLAPTAGMNPKEQREYKGMFGDDGLDAVNANLLTYGRLFRKNTPAGIPGQR